MCYFFVPVSNSNQELYFFFNDLLLKLEVFETVWCNYCCSSPQRVFCAKSWESIKMEGRNWNVLTAALRTLVTAQQIKKQLMPQYVVFMCLAMNCFSSQSSFLVYERTGIFVLVVLVILSLLGKVHLAKWNGSQAYCNKVRKFVVYYKQKACESALKIEFLLITYYLDFK